MSPELEDHLVEHNTRQGVATAPARARDFTPEAASVRYARLLAVSRGWIGKFAVIGVVISIAIAFLIPTQYESTVRLMPPEQQQNSALNALAALTGGERGGLATMAGGMLGVKNSGELFVGVLKSRTVQERIVRKFDLRSVYGVKLEQSACEKLASRTSISEDRKSGIISVAVEDRSRERARDIAADYIAELDSVIASVATSSARRERIFLEDRLKEVKVDLDDATKKLSEFSSKNRTIDLKDQGKAMLEAAANVQGTLMGAKSQLAGLRQVYTSNNVRVKSAEAHIAQLEKELTAFGGNSGGTDSVNSVLGIPSIQELPLIGASYAGYYRRAKIEEAVYGTLTQQYELAKVQEAKEIPSVRVLDPANLAERKSFPPRGRIIGLLSLLALLLASGWVIVQDIWTALDPDDPRKRTMMELRRLFALER
jgi:uncharacterized protein involved in exopolysaccharide biosynthesis